MSAAPEHIDALLRRLRESEAIGELDAHFAAFICRHAARPTTGLALAAALVSHATVEGNICIDLAAHAGRHIADGAFDAPSLDDWSGELIKSGAAVRPGEHAPLVLDGSRLYLYRYWRYECAVAGQLRARAVQPSPDIDAATLRAALDRWFAAETETDWQKVAAALAATQPLAIISGGPGTGKTTTVMRALAVLAETSPRPLRMALAAPTGKAAARLQEALRHARASMRLAPEVDAQLPREAATLHRLLGVLPGRTRFRHDREHPLPLDVLVVDEASMIDLALMAKLLDALPLRTRLIVLGDKDQLASVEAGAVLHSMCAGPDAYGPAMAARLKALTGYDLPGVADAPPLADAVALLQRRYRFAADSPIAALADAARAGGADAVLRVLERADGDAAVWHAQSDQGALVAALADRYEPLIDAAQSGAAPEHVYGLLRAHGVLCAHRTGPYGAATLNGAVESELRRRGRIAEPGSWFRGRPVMVQRNDYAARLYNGDLGVTLADGEGRLGVYFPDGAGQLRRYAPARLPACDSAFAMTVHKSQGSEFDAVDVVLPGEVSPVLTRELFYTAVTRAMARVAVWGSAEIVRATLTARVERDSALAQRLWHQAAPAPGARQGELFGETE